jgi:dihydroorotate dehydrogenase
LRIGVNFGSSRPGLGEAVIADYCVALRMAYPHADYLCGNLSAPHSGRDGGAPGALDLIAQLKTERDRLAAAMGVRRPLLMKLAAGEGDQPLPAALAESCRLELDGIVLVSSDLRRIAAVSRAVAPLSVISVGGIETAAHVVARLAGGATLVQVHKAFVAGLGGRLPA